MKKLLSRGSPNLLTVTLVVLLVLAGTYAYAAETNDVVAAPKNVADVTQNTAAQTMAVLTETVGNAPPSHTYVVLLVDVKKIAASVDPKKNVAGLVNDVVEKSNTKVEGNTQAKAEENGANYSLVMMSLDVGTCDEAQITDVATIDKTRTANYDAYNLSPVDGLVVMTTATPPVSSTLEVVDIADNDSVAGNEVASTVEKKIAMAKTATSGEVGNYMGVWTITS